MMVFSAQNLGEIANSSSSINYVCLFILSNLKMI